MNEDDANEALAIIAELCTEIRNGADATGNPALARARKFMQQQRAKEDGRLGETRTIRSRVNNETKEAGDV